MFKNHGVIYVLNQKMNGKDMYERLARTRQELMKFGCRELEDEVVEADAEERTSLINLLVRYNDHPMVDPIIAVSTWKEISHPEIAKRLLDGGYSVVVADEAENFEQSKEGDERFVFRGPVMDHIVKFRSKLAASLDGFTYVKRSETNTARRNKATEFAEYMWPYIEAAAKEAKTTNQGEIARMLTASGLKPVEGEVIQQAHVSRYIDRVGKRKEWKALEKAFKELEKALKEPELFTAEN